jgi:hypothetical protein
MGCEATKVGWKTQTILVRPAVLDGGPEKLLAALGHDRPRKVSETSFSSAGAGSIWIGAIADCVILYTHLAAGFFDENDDREFNDFKAALLQRFPDADVAALFLHSVVGAWGFAVYQRGTLIRHQHGYDGMVLRDEGPRVPAEETYLARFERHDVDGKILYRDPVHPEWSDMSDPDFGEGLVFEICRSFTGFPLDQLDDVRGVNFWLSEEEEQGYARSRAGASAAIDQSLHAGRVRGAVASRPWWKFWG